MGTREKNTNYNDPVKKDTMHPIVSQCHGKYIFLTIISNNLLYLLNAPKPIITKSHLLITF